MAINFISGKPRGGKSLRAVGLLLDELRYGKRNVVTNLALDLDAVQDWLHAQGAAVHVLDRVTLLSQEEVGEFYRHRGSGVVLEYRYAGGLDSKGNRLLDTQAPLEIDPTLANDQTALGVVYFLDELHIYFNARKWKETGDVALWYLSQHAKLGDDVWCITQSIGNVDKQFRSVAQEFRYVRNYSKEKWGSFKMGDYFEERTYMQPVTGDKDPASDTYKFKLDKGVAACYYTAGGVGVPAGAAADIGKKAKGLPMWSLWAAAAALMVGLWFASDYVPKLLDMGISKSMGTGQSLTQKETTSEPKPNVLQEYAASFVPPAPVAVRRTQTVDTRAARVTVTGVVSDGKRLMVRLSDGRVLNETDPVSRVDRHGVRMRDGTLYHYAEAKPRPAVSGDLIRPPVPAPVEPVPLVSQDEPRTSSPFTRISPVRIAPPNSQRVNEGA